MTRFAGSNPKLANFMSKPVQYDQIGNTAQDAHSAKRQTAVMEEAKTAGAGLNAMGMIEKAKYDGQAMIAQGQAQAAATRAQGMSNMFGSIAGGIGSMSFGGGFTYAGGPGSTGTAMGAGGGVVGGMGTYGPNYGIPQ